MGLIDQEGGADRPVNGADRPGADRPWGGSTVNRHFSSVFGNRHCQGSSPAGEIAFGNSADKISDAYSAEKVLLNKQQIWCGGAYLHCYLAFFNQTNTTGELPGQEFFTCLVARWLLCVVLNF